MTSVVTDDVDYYDGGGMRWDCSGEQAQPAPNQTLLDFVNSMEDGPYANACVVPAGSVESVTGDIPNAEIVNYPVT